jgi:ATP-binding cassette subfamily C exporter for protease/lipase
LLLQAVASDFAGNSQAGTKFVTMLQGSLIMAIGALVNVYAYNNPGAVATGASPINPALLIVASILGGRALAPISSLVMQWRQIAMTWDAYLRLDQLLANISQGAQTMKLPPPNGALVVEQVVAAAPGNPQPILRGINCGLTPGQLMVVMGPSGAGKSTLAKAMLGSWPLSAGKVRLDGADVHAWHKDDLGPYLGYLPQQIELFEGTIAENIARFQTPDQAQLHEAVMLSGLQGILHALPQGLETEIGDLGNLLSGGQRQRVGLARAIYGRPRLIVLDEPNASLDALGEQALNEALIALKAAGAMIVVVTHRTDLLALADTMLILRDGQVQAFGPRDQVLAALQRAAEEQRARLEAAARNKASAQPPAQPES